MAAVDPKNLADLVPREIEIVNGIIENDGSPVNGKQKAAVSPTLTNGISKSEILTIPAADSSPTILQPLPAIR